MLFWYAISVFVGNALRVMASSANIKNTFRYPSHTFLPIGRANIELNVVDGAVSPTLFLELFIQTSLG